MYSSGERVELCNLGGDYLEGYQGTIIGWSVEHIINHYIVLLDKPIFEKNFVHKAVSLPEVCLKRVL